jgi:hypothetical protein
VQGLGQRVVGQLPLGVVLHGQPTAGEAADTTTFSLAMGQPTSSRATSAVNPGTPDTPGASEIGPRRESTSAAFVRPARNSPTAGRPSRPARWT